MRAAKLQNEIANVNRDLAATHSITQLVKLRAVVSCVSQMFACPYYNLQHRFVFKSCFYKYRHKYSASGWKERIRKSYSQVTVPCCKVRYQIRISPVYDCTPIRPVRRLFSRNGRIFSMFVRMYYVAWGRHDAGLGGFFRLATQSFTKCFYARELLQTLLWYAACFVCDQPPLAAQIQIKLPWQLFFYIPLSNQVEALFSLYRPSSSVKCSRCEGRRTAYIHDCNFAWLPFMLTKLWGNVTVTTPVELNRTYSIPQMSLILLYSEVGLDDEISFLLRRAHSSG